MKLLRRLGLVSVVTLVFVLAASTAYGHSGGLNANGCHAGSKPYHCHRSPSEMVRTADGRNRLRCDLGSRSIECIGTTTAATLLPDQLQTSISVGEAYRRIVIAVDGQGYTEAINVMYFDRLHVRFSEANGFALLHFEGNNMALFELIREAVR